MLTASRVAAYWGRKDPKMLPYARLEAVVEYAEREGAAMMLLPKSGHHPSICSYAIGPRDTEDLVVVREWDRFTLVEIRDH